MIDLIVCMSLPVYLWYSYEYTCLFTVRTAWITEQLNTCLNRTPGSVPPFWGLACAPIVETSFLKLDVSFLDFSPWIPLGTLCILLKKGLAYRSWEITRGSNRIWTGITLCLLSTFEKRIYHSSKIWNLFNSSRKFLQRGLK